MKAYLAARYSRIDELNTYREHLRMMGVEVTSRWLDGEHRAADEDLTANVDLAHRFAADDLQDIRAADVLVAFTEEPRSGASRGGRHVELGWALASNKKILVCGPRENVFHCLGQVEVYPTWPACLARIGRLMQRAVVVKEGRETL